MQEQLEDMIDTPVPYRIDFIAKKVLFELLKVCEEHDMSKEGLMEEFRSGIREDYLNNVTWANGEAKDLDLERMAMIGDKRRKLQNQDGQTSEEAEDWPVKIVDAQLEV